MWPARAHQHPLLARRFSRTKSNRHSFATDENRAPPKPKCQRAHTSRIASPTHERQKDRFGFRDAPFGNGNDRLLIWPQINAEYIIRPFRRAGITMHQI